MPGRRVIFIGGADDLQLEPGGKLYHPGDPITISDIQRASLTASGHRFGAVPEVTGADPEPDPAPEPPPPLEPAEASRAAVATRGASQPPAGAPTRAAASAPKEAP